MLQWTAAPNAALDRSMLETLMMTRDIGKVVERTCNVGSGGGKRAYIGEVVNYFIPVIYLALSN